MGKKFSAFSVNTNSIKNIENVNSMIYLNPTQKEKKNVFNS